MAKWYANALAQALGSAVGGGAPNIDWLSDDIRVALVTNAYTPDLVTHDFWNDVVANEASGAGYTANGLALASKTGPTITAANSWGVTAAISTAYVVGDVVKPSGGNTYLYRCVVAGTSGGSAPTWPTVIGTTVADGGVTWLCVGKSILTLDCADPSWATITTTARYGVVYNRTPATDATRPLVGLIDFGADKSPSAGTLTITVHSAGLLVAFFE